MLQHINTKTILCTDESDKYNKFPLRLVKYWLLIYLWNIKLNNGLSITMVLFFTFISHVQPLLTLIKKNPKRFFSEKEIFYHGICLSPSNPSTVIYTHTDSFHAFKWMLWACRKYLQALVYSCKYNKSLKVLRYFILFVQQFQFPITAQCTVIKISIYHIIIYYIIIYFYENMTVNSHII